MQYQLKSLEIISNCFSFSPYFRLMQWYWCDIRLNIPSVVLVLISFKFHTCSCVMKAPLAFSIIILISLLVFPYYNKSSEDGWTWPDHFNPNLFFTVKLHSDFIAKLHSDFIVKQVYFVSIFSKILAHTPCGGCIDMSLVLFRFGKYFITDMWRFCCLPNTTNKLIMLTKTLLLSHLKYVGNTLICTVAKNQ